MFQTILSGVLWGVAVAASAVQAEAIPVVTMARQPADAPRGEAHPLLPRELIRQGVLIAARDGFGAATRDAVLGEPTDVAGSLQLAPDLKPDGDVLHIAVSKRDSTDSIWAADLPADLCNERLTDATVEIEKLSRGPFVDGLKKAGLTGAADRVDANGAASPSALAQLDHFELLSQLTAIRLLHAQIRADGESPDRLAALARAYANFSQLSRFIWGGESQAAAARALLYAQRGVATFPDAPAAWFGRIYVESLIGLPQSALDDLASVRSKHPDVTPPAWVELAEQLAKYDPEALLTLADKQPANAVLARYFAFLTIQNSNADAAVVNFAEAALTLEPDCQQLIARINDDTGPGLTHSGAEAFSQTLAGLDQLPAVPADLRQVVQAKQGSGANAEVRLVDQLHHDGDADRSEPSWHVMGRLIENVTFMNAEAEAMHITFSLGQDPSNFVNSIWPSVKNHPYASVMAAYRDVGTGGPEAFTADLAKVKIDDPMLSAMSQISQYWLRAPQTATEADTFSLMRGADAIAPDEELKAQITKFVPIGDNPFGIGFKLDRLKRLCPNSPTVMAATLNADWNTAEPHLAEWLDQVGDHPAVTYAAASQYFNHREYNKAAAMFEKYISVSPDSHGFKALASCYLRQHNEKAWLATLERSLKYPALGLEHARTNETIAKYFLTTKRYKEALPFAEASGDSYSAWGLEIAARANEAVGNWDRAEELTKARGENYGDPTAWLGWCCRTGHGDRKAAEQYARAGLAASVQRTDRESKAIRVSFDLYTQNDAEAERLATEMARDLGDPWAGLHAVLFAIARHDDAARDQDLAWVIHPNHEFRLGNGQTRPQLVQLAQMIQTAMHDQSKPLDAGQVDRLAMQSAFEAPNIYYFSGRYCELQGRVPLAKQFYEKCAAREETSTNLDLANMRLKALQPQAPATRPQN